MKPLKKNPSKIISFFSKFGTFIGIAFFLYYIYLNIDNYKMILNISWSNFFLSIFFLVLGFFLGGFLWYLSLNIYGFDVSFYYSFYSHGISIFSKYIPGKVWTILNRSTYISKLGYPLSQITYISTNLQIINILIGLLFGLIPITSLNINPYFRILLIIIIITILIIMINPYLNHRANIIIEKVTKGKFSIPRINKKNIIIIVILTILQWGIYSTGFFFLAKSIMESQIVPYSISFVFPLSLNIGLLAFFAPGGIGIREASMISLLNLFGISSADSTFISILSRLWFTLGELIIFVSATFIRTKNNSKEGGEFNNPS